MLTFFFAVARFAGFLVRSIPSSSSVSSLSSSVYCFRAVSRVGFLMNKDGTIHMERIIGTFFYAGMIAVDQNTT